MVAEKYFNYFKDVNPDFENNDFSLNKRIDPDSLSKKLYEQLGEIFCDDKVLPCNNTIRIVKIPLRKYETGKGYELVVNILEKDRVIYTIGLGADFIGASVGWAIDAGLDKKEIISNLNTTRTIGGHMLFPRWIRIRNELGERNPFINGISINKAKGTGRGLFDRIDWTLNLLKSYFNCIHEEDIDKRSQLYREEQLVKYLLSYKDLAIKERKNLFNPEGSANRLFEAFENSREWLKLFGCFNQFIIFFELEDLLDKDNSVKELAPWFPVLPVQYKDYMDKSLDFARKRTNSLYN